MKSIEQIITLLLQKEKYSKKLNEEEVDKLTHLSSLSPEHFFKEIQNIIYQQETLPLVRQLLTTAAFEYSNQNERLSQEYSKFFQDGYFICNDLNGAYSTKLCINMSTGEINSIIFYENCDARHLVLDSQSNHMSLRGLSIRSFGERILTKTIKVPGFIQLEDMKLINGELSDRSHTKMAYALTQPIINLDKNLMRQLTPADKINTSLYIVKQMLIRLKFLHSFGYYYNGELSSKDLYLNLNNASNQLDDFKLFLMSMPVNFKDFEKRAFNKIVSYFPSGSGKVNPPEMNFKRKDVDYFKDKQNLERLDVWSVGCILFELLHDNFKDLSFYNSMYIFESFFGGIPLSASIEENYLKQLISLQNRKDKHPQVRYLYEVNGFEYLRDYLEDNPRENEIFDLLKALLCPDPENRPLIEDLLNMPIIIDDSIFIEHPLKEVKIPTSKDLFVPEFEYRKDLKEKDSLRELQYIQYLEGAIDVFPVVKNRVHQSSLKFAALDIVLLNLNDCPEDQMDLFTVPVKEVLLNYPDRLRMIKFYSLNNEDRRNFDRLTDKFKL